jgi:hypothetical protein
MQDMTKYKEIIPGKKRFETLVTRVFFFFIGMSMQTATFPWKIPSGGPSLIHQSRPLKKNCSRKELM